MDDGGFVDVDGDGGGGDWVGWLEGDLAFVVVEAGLVGGLGVDFFGEFGEVEVELAAAHVGDGEGDSFFVVDGDDVEPVTVEGDGEAVAVEVTPEFEDVGNGGGFEVIDGPWFFDVGFGGEGGVAADGVPGHVEEDEGDEEVDLVGALHGFGEVGVPGVEAEPVVGGFASVLEGAALGYEDGEDVVDFVHVGAEHVEGGFVAAEEVVGVAEAAAFVGAEGEGVFVEVVGEEVEVSFGFGDEAGLVAEELEVADLDLHVGG